VLVEVAGFALNAAVTPLGKPDAESVTPPLNLFTGVMVMVLFMLLPGEIIMVFGEGRRLKLAALVGPIVHQIGGVHRPDAAREIPAGGSNVRPAIAVRVRCSHEVVDVESTPTGPLG